MYRQSEMRGAMSLTTAFNGLAKVVKNFFVGTGLPRILTKIDGNALGHEHSELQIGVLSTCTLYMYVTVLQMTQYFGYF